MALLAKAELRERRALTSMMKYCHKMKSKLEHKCGFVTVPLHLQLVIMYVRYLTITKLYELMNFPLSALCFFNFTLDQFHMYLLNY